MPAAMSSRDGVHLIKAASTGLKGHHLKRITELVWLDIQKAALRQGN